MGRLLFPVLLALVFLVFLSGCTQNDVAQFFESNPGLTDAAAGLGGELACDKVDDVGAREHCWQKTAIVKGKPELCEKISDPAPKAKCYSELAVKLKDPTLCDSVNGGITGDDPRECLQAVAQATGDKSLCDKIAGDVSRMGMVTASKDKCLAQLGVSPGPGEKPGDEPTEPEPKGECRFDSDCNPLCVGNVMWAQGCDARTNKCVKTFDDDCAKESVSVAGYSFPGVCRSNAEAVFCVVSKQALQAQKDELVLEGNDYTASMQETTRLRQHFVKECLNTLADVTDKFIIDSALMLKKMPTKMFSVLSSNLQKLINYGLDKAVGADKPSMSPEEYIAWTCNMSKVLDTDHALLDKKRSQVLDEIAAINEAMAEAG